MNTRMNNIYKNLKSVGSWPGNALLRSHIERCEWQRPERAWTLFCLWSVITIAYSMYIIILFLHMNIDHGRTSIGVCPVHAMQGNSRSAFVHVFFYRRSEMHREFRFSSTHSICFVFFFQVGRNEKYFLNNYMVEVYQIECNLLSDSWINPCELTTQHN